VSLPENGKKRTICSNKYTQLFQKVSLHREKKNGALMEEQEELGSLFFFWQPFLLWLFWI
jgi:hypothetical protein